MIIDDAVWKPSGEQAGEKAFFRHGSFLGAIT
jgi:hypothetical protein